MNKIIMVGLALLYSTWAIADIQVNGYYKKNGTYVQPYVKTDPNNTKYDNWSTKGNVNPYTGKAGNKNPY